MKRLFIALDFPETTDDALLDLCELGMQHATWAHAFHLTLRFVGEVDEGMFDDIRTALAELQMPAFSLTLKGVGFFPPRKQPKVLWVGVEKNENLRQLKRKVDYQLAQLGLTGEKRKFHPHVTLARLQNPSGDAIGMYLVRHSLFKTPPLQINQFHLFSSQLSPGGAIHTKEATYELENPSFLKEKSSHSVDHSRNR